MKRTYDYSFVSSTDDRHNITSGIHIHSFEQTAAQATHQHLTNYSTIPQNLFLAANSVPPVVPTLELRVPLLSSTVGFSSDFQSNAGLCDTYGLTTGINGSRPRLAGLGIRYDGPLVMNAFPSGNVTTPQEPKPPYLSKTCSSELNASPQLSELALHDICNLDSSPIEPGLSSESLSETYPSQSSTNETSAYSECPFLDYTAHSSSASSSLGSLSYGSGSEPDFNSNLNTSPGPSIVDYLRLSTPPIHSLDNPFAPEPPLVGLYADINMHELAYKNQPEGQGVNPADLTGNVHIKSEALDYDMSECVAPSELTSLPSDPAMEPIADETLNTIISILSGPSKDEKSESKYVLRDVEPPAIATGPMSIPTLSCAPGVSTNLAPPTRSTPMLHLVPPPGYPVAPNFGFIAQQAPPDIFHADHGHIHAQMHTQSRVLTPKVQAVIVRPQSPVLNAHHGIDLDDLRRRAEEFRIHNPGVELDKMWLQEYAGRLSTRGELMDDYRCYVNGCTQKNKRRDHILVHVGSHVEHRPFHCTTCGMRFLRKNECKRHESSHAGRKPFSCPICAPYQDRSFVRQDLLKRHMRVTHGVQPETAMDRRKRVRLMSKGPEDGEYWP